MHIIMKPNIVLFGGGNHAHYTIDIIEKENKYTIIGIIDSIQSVGTICFGYKILGDVCNLKQIVEEYDVFGGIISIGDNWTRLIVREKILIEVPIFNFVNAIHPSVIVGNNCSIGVGVIAMAGCIFNPKSTIGNFTFFATGSQIEHDCTIEEYASVSAGSILGGFVKIKRLSAVTLGVTVFDRIEIGENSVIGAGSLVVKSIPDNVLAYGSPAKIIRTRKLGEKFLK
jgi:sugar O-acyltransferase (sialic acid O-acetyltransferase NeuD family)